MTERHLKTVKKGVLLKAIGLPEGIVAYNPAVLGTDKKGRKIIAARTESADSDWQNRLNSKEGPYDPSIRFFTVKKDKLIPIANSPVLNGMEDPFCTTVTVDGKKKLLFGGVRVDFDTSIGAEITTEIYMSEDLFGINEDSRIATVRGMKDIRFCQTSEGDLVMLTRPTTGEAYPGSIGFNRIILKDLVDGKLLDQKIKEARLMHFNLKGVKLGPNALYRFPKGKKELYRLLCHAATADPYKNAEGKVIENDFDLGRIHYYAYQGFIDPENWDSEIKLGKVAQASDFELKKEDIKGPRYEDVVFPGGIIKGKLIVGVGDRTIGRIKID